MLLKDLKSAFLEGVEYNVALPFNALAATQLFDPLGKENPGAHRAEPVCGSAVVTSRSGETRPPDRGNTLTGFQPG